MMVLLNTAMLVTQLTVLMDPMKTLPTVVLLVLDLTQLKYVKPRNQPVQMTMNGCVLMARNASLKASSVMAQMLTETHNGDLTVPMALMKTWVCVANWALPNIRTIFVLQVLQVMVVWNAVLVNGDALMVRVVSQKGFFVMDLPNTVMLVGVQTVQMDLMKPWLCAVKMVSMTNPCAQQEMDLEDVKTPACSCAELETASPEHSSVTEPLISDQLAGDPIAQMRLMKMLPNAVQLVPPSTWIMDSADLYSYDYFLNKF